MECNVYIYIEITITYITILLVRMIFYFIRHNHDGMTQLDAPPSSHGGFSMANCECHNQMVLGKTSCHSKTIPNTMEQTSPPLFISGGLSPAQEAEVIRKQEAEKQRLRRAEARETTGAFASFTTGFTGFTRNGENEGN